MPDFLRWFDGSGRDPREVQRRTLQWLSANWDRSKIFAIQAPTGVGKTAMARAIQLATGAHSIVISNALMDQYTGDYPQANYLKGIAHYECHQNAGFTCDERRELKMSPCKDCKYASCRREASKGASTIFNPISYHYLEASLHERPKVLVSDETHRLADTMSLVSGVRFSKQRYAYPKMTSLAEVAAWMRLKAKTLGSLRAQYHSSGMMKEYKAVNSQWNQINQTLVQLDAEPDKFIFFERTEPYRGKTEEYLYVVPVEVPNGLLSQFFRYDKVVLLSATLGKYQVNNLVRGRPYLYLDVPSPIPLENRPIYFAPGSSGGLSWQSPPEEVAKWIRDMRARFPDRNTLVHVTYDLAQRLRPLISDCFINTPDDKMKVVKEFREKGGIWLASGCAEGIDLPGDSCRLNLIPVLNRPNTKDPVVAKRLTLPNGWFNYHMETITTFVQQAGRSTRGIDDHSIVVTGDAKFPALIARQKPHISKSVFDAIHWRLP